MTKLLVIADDFTGALDTGIQLVRSGVKTSVVIGSENILASRSEFPVVVADTETRHLKPSRAYDIVYKLVTEARELGIKYVYKKTDSALRGCVGAELSAALDACAGTDVLEFVPAFPKTHRSTENGTQYIDGVPVSESAFGRDPFEPVRHSYIPDIIAEQSETPVVIDGGPVPEGKHIALYNAVTDDDLAAIAARLKTKGATLMAGCAGFASLLDSLADLPHGETAAPRLTDGMFVVCGSLNSISEEQVNYAESAGFARIQLNAVQELEPGYLTSAAGQEWLAKIKEMCGKDTPVMLDSFKSREECEVYAAEHGISNDKLRSLVAGRFGEIIREWTEFRLNHTLVVIGGDTLAAFMGVIGCNEVTPICELSNGVVCSVLKWSGREIQIISKSGGFGHKEVLTDIKARVCAPKA